MLLGFGGRRLLLPAAGGAGVASGLLRHRSPLVVWLPSSSSALAPLSAVSGRLGTRAAPRIQVARSGYGGGPPGALARCCPLAVPPMPCARRRLRSAVTRVLFLFLPPDYLHRLFIRCYGASVLARELSTGGRGAGYGGVSIIAQSVGEPSTAVGPRIGPLAFLR